MNEYNYKQKQVRTPNRDVEVKGQIEDREEALTGSLKRHKRQLEGLALEWWGLSHRWDNRRKI